MPAARRCGRKRAAGIAESIGYNLHMPRRKQIGGISAAFAAIAFLVSGCGTSPAASASVPPAATPSFTPFQLPSPSPTAGVALTVTASPTPSPTREGAATRIPIIEYHFSNYKFSDDVMMTSDWFREQTAWLADNGYRTITAEQLAAFLDGGQVPAKSVVLTFDIGTAQRADFAGVIVPALRERGMHALFFVVTGAITDECGAENKVCWQDLRDWSSEGLISVESHGISHPDYQTIDTEEQRWDLTVSRQIIAAQTGRAPVAFAYPFDSYNEGATRVVKSAGYQFAVAGNTRKDRSARLSDPDRYSLPRVYPYSNPRLYPVLYGADGMTFGEMISAASESSVGGSPSPSAAEATPTAERTRPSTDAFAAACARIDSIADPIQRVSELNRLAFALDLGTDAQSRLGTPVILRPSCNWMQGNVPRGIVLHSTRGTLAATLNEFQRPANTSVHYVIDRDGQVYQVVPETLGAYHASCGGKRSVCLPDCPLCEGPDGAFREPYLQSVGIELVNDGQLSNPASYGGLIYEDYLMSFGYRYWEDFPEAQLRSLIVLVTDIRARWGISLPLVVGQYRINSKTDPGPALNISWYRTGNPPRPPIFTE
jgi:peptidoglycan/xylan/chitin deacetylase (PgdA/CDA1 family)